MCRRILSNFVYLLDLPKFVYVIEPPLMRTVLSIVFELDTGAITSTGAELDTITGCDTVVTITC